MRRWLARRARKWRLFWAARHLSRLARARRRAAFGLKAVLFMGVLAASIYLINTHVPPQHLPWRSLNTQAPTGLSTRLQLLRVALSPSARCMDMARGTPFMESIPADPKDGDGPCGWKVARLMYGTSAASLAPGEAALQCPLALGSYIWMQEIDRLAKKHLGAKLSQMHHAGSYSCRRQRGNGSGAWSEHAFANAFDITGFTLSDGRVISVLRDWDGAPKKKAFLRGVRDEACKIFRVTLSPDFNAAHKDHFHVDMGPQSTCR